MTRQADTETTAIVYFATRNGKVMTWGTDAPLSEVRAYVMRNNMAARRRGDLSKPYAILGCVIPA